MPLEVDSSLASTKIEGIDAPFNAKVDFAPNQDILTGKDEVGLNLATINDFNPSWVSSVKSNFDYEKHIKIAGQGTEDLSLVGS